MNPQRQSIFRFIRQTLLVAIPPILPSVVFFLLVDPFKAVHAYTASEYFPDPDRNPVRVSVNKGLASLAAFEHNMERCDTCNSFIFGSSISVYYDIDHWREKLDSPENVRSMHFDSSSESIYSLSRKIAYIDSRVDELRNALIVLDPIIMATEENESPYAIDPPSLHPGDLLFRLRYLYTFFRASTNADFFKNWMPYAIDGKTHDNAHNRLFEPQPIIYDSIRNQETIPEFDAIIRESPVAYYSMFPLMESPDTTSVSAPTLTSDKLKALHLIASVFRHHDTDYKIIIGPNRRKVVLNPADRDSLSAIFGADNVKDFSLSHAFRLQTDTLLYDNTHYRPCFAAELLDLAYPDKH